MIGVIAKGFLKKLFSGDLVTGFVTFMVVILLLMSIPTISKVATFFGYETKQSLREQVAVQKKNVEVLKDVVDNKEVVNKVLEGTVDNTVKAFENKITNDTKTVAKIAKIQTDRKEKIAVIQQLPDLPEVQKIEKESELRITSIWQAFCTASDDPECKVQLQGVST